MNILIVDDHPFIHEYIGATLRKAFGECAVRHALSLAEALEKAAAAPPVEVALLDLGLKDSSGLRTLRRFRKELPDVRVVVFSADDHPDLVLGAIKAGAVGYLPKTSPFAVVQAALGLVAAGGTSFPPPALEEAYLKLAAPAEPDLTGRQAEVVRLIALGFANKEIAQRLEITEDTVKQHARAAYAALGVSSRTQAVNALARRGIPLD